MNEPLGQSCTRTLTVVALAAAVGCFGPVPQEASAQAHTQPATATAPASDCKRCHICEKPTLNDPCLPGCTRVQAAAEELARKRGPDVVVLDELQDAYLPVPFDHKGHADMAEMTQGCTACHHYTPEEQQHPACKACHEITVKGTGIYKPGLKGAYHRQCLNCHKDWTDASNCAICHRRRTAGPKTRDAASPTTAGDILERMHPPIQAPGTEIYRAEFKKGTESSVIFRHWEHVGSFDLKCVDCHHAENCSRCHKKDNGEKRPRTVADHHKPCLRCHERDMKEPTSSITGKCTRCHWQEGRPMPKPFDHADTGWPLSGYHEGVSCRGCHINVPYVKLSNECNSCHSEWDPDSFDHSVTGQWLDSNHKEIDCADCHADRKFDVKPRCDECHDEDEGYVYPKKRPGAVMKSKGDGSQ